MLLPYPTSLLSPLREIPRSLFERHDTLLESTDRCQCIGQAAGRQPRGNDGGNQGAGLNGFLLDLRPMQSLLQLPLEDHVENEPAHDG